MSSAGSATSAPTSRSGGSTTASENFASVCSFVLCDSGTFLKFWLEDKCRDTFLSLLPKNDIASLRLACHDFSVRAAPALFSDLSITFKTSTFTRPARIAALDRLGFYVKTLRINLPHTTETFLPPLIEPDTGEELSFTYTPQIHRTDGRHPKYGDLGTTEILTRQYPALFHAATNVPAFIRAFSTFFNLQHLQLSCPGYDPATRYRRSIIDFALISIRIAVERNCLNTLDTLTLSPMHPGSLQYLSPSIGHGATPRSAKVWSRICNLDIMLHSIPSPHGDVPADHTKMLNNYLRNFQPNLTILSSRWLGCKGPLPTAQPLSQSSSGHFKLNHPSAKPKAMPALRFPSIKSVEMAGVTTTAAEVQSFAAMHKHTIEELKLDDLKFTEGSWDEALSPLTRQARPRTTFADIPIMLSPTSASPARSHPMAMDRVQAKSNSSHRPTLRLSKWLPGKADKHASSSRRVRGGLLGCEEQLKKVLGGVLSWH
ncbi:hypothetical protein LTR86_007142 [Recurvomyces mirabilis]|nr:hypothetical protein LTR86_007142 [Recurvomyces mirabilis]